MEKITKMKNYFLNHKGICVAIIIEIVWVLCIIFTSLGRTVNIELRADDFELYDSDAQIRDYELVDSLVKDDNTLVVYDNKETSNIENSIYISEKDEPSSYTRCIAGSKQLTLRPGMYEIEAKYYSLCYTEDGGSSEAASGEIDIVSYNNESNIFYNELQLYDNVTVNQQRLWIRSLKSIDDIQVKISYYGIGYLRLDSIVIKEFPIWRLFKLIAWILAFAGIDLVYILLFGDSKFKEKEILAILILVGFFSCLPVFTNFLFTGHDLKYHTGRIWALAENIKQGKIAYPIQIEMLNGYGYVSPIFYGQLLLYIPAVMYIIGAPMQVCFQLYIVLVNITTMLICYYCVKGIVDDSEIAVAGAALYTMAAYRISNIYVREAVGEYSAMMFLPLIVYGFVKIYSKKVTEISIKDVMAIVIGLTGIIQTHVLTCEMSAIFIFLLCIIMFKKTFEFKRFIALGITATITGLLNMAFFIPFLDTMRSSIKIFMEGVDRIQYNGVYLIQILGVFMTSGGLSGERMQGEMPLTLGFSLLIGMGVFLYCCMKKYNDTSKTYMKIGKICTGFAVCTIILTLRIFPWDSLEQISSTLAKIFCAIQYPWRYISLTTIFALVATVSGLKIIKEHISKSFFRLIEATLIVFTVIQIGSFYIDFANSNNTVTIYGGADVIKNITIGNGEYIVNGTSIEQLNWKSIKADLANVEISNYKSYKGVVTFDCNNISNQEQFVRIPVLFYDDYHVYTDDGTELYTEAGENNRIGIWVPAQYRGTVRVQYEIPVLWKLANIITMITFGGIVISYIALGRKRICLRRIKV